MLRLFVFVLGCLGFLTWSCSSPKASDEEGEKLAQTYCGSCHRLPTPSELDKKTWLLGVLPEMGARLGIPSFAGMNYRPKTGDSTFYASQPALTPLEWEKLVNYYYNAAPDSLDRTYQPIQPQTPLFLTRQPSLPIAGPPTTTYVKIDPIRHGIYEAQGIGLTFQSFNQKLELVSELKTPQVVVDVAFPDQNKKTPIRATLLNMGALTPADVTHGSIQYVTIDDALHLKGDGQVLVDQLPRPVNIQSADINRDGLEDFVICGYGNFVGELFWLKGLGHDQFEKVSIKQQAGSIQTVVLDYNNDGLPDILALMAQGNEGINLFEQGPDGKFKERQLLQFSPVAGSISIDLVDFNGDGFRDILYTSGDNADFSKILKPYHGVYLFMNDGHWNFKQEYFFRINGCFDAVARDFDLDGDLDIAAIAFFADYAKRPEEGFVFLQNNGHLDFTPYTIAEHAAGRWIALDAADIDGDGDCDIVLGNLSIGPANLRPKTEWRNGPPFLLLENKTR